MAKFELPEIELVNLEVEDVLAGSHTPDTTETRWSNPYCPVELPPDCLDDDE